MPNNSLIKSIENTNRDCKKLRRLIKWTVKNDNVSHFSKFIPIIELLLGEIVVASEEEGWICIFENMTYFKESFCGLEKLVDVDHSGEYNGLFTFTFSNNDGEESDYWYGCNDELYEYLWDLIKNI